MSGACVRGALRPSPVLPFGACGGNRAPIGEAPVAKEARMRKFPKRFTKPRPRTDTKLRKLTFYH